MWFFDFVGMKWQWVQDYERAIASLTLFFSAAQLLQNISKAKSENWDLCACATYAYDETLGTHHPFVIRIAAKAGMKFFPAFQVFACHLFRSCLALSCFVYLSCHDLFLYISWLVIAVYVLSHNSLSLIIYLDSKMSSVPTDLNQFLDGIMPGWGFKYGSAMDASGLE